MQKDTMNTNTLTPLEDHNLLTHQDLLAALNQSIELKCLLKSQLEEADPTGEYCPTSFDSILCWPRTPRATLAVLPCLEELQGVHYDSSQNATRYCTAEGVWDNYTNYGQCLHLPESSVVPEFEPNIELPTFIYYVGYTISLISLTLAVLVFSYFKELRCLRNTIHGNLFLTYIMSGLLWILTLSVQISIRTGLGGCIILVTLFHYFSLTNFFWMLVEGLYLYMLVVKTFSGDNIRFTIYAIIGWGGPAVFVFIWVIAKGLTTAQFSSEKLNIECPWMHDTPVDWIFQGPACTVLIINLIFLLRIMWVLITKLRSANTVETRQYRKAAKALLVLIPLFGITYLVVLTGPNEGVGSYIFAIARSVLLSTQGFSVSLFYCFLNSEVRTALRHHVVRWHDERNIRLGQLRRSRRPQTTTYSRWESCTSTGTTTTLLGPPATFGYQQRGSNGLLSMQDTTGVINSLIEQGVEENSV
ncbi:diuretic hormone receptor isoform X2 [Hermetia illucens]|uniref:diuretic hormone receptor isoform X2 n=1 Tax=Hermetia illucens TaxID=343691 RepID=UPI0018CC57B8|nr:diuretic hormone receptor isoform X2 [Hermetia illucens]